jgi:hypothetical protein
MAMIILGWYRLNTNLRKDLRHEQEESIDADRSMQAECGPGADGQGIRH